MNRLRFLKTAYVPAIALLLASCSQDGLTEQGTPLPVGQYQLELTAGGLQAVATPATRGTMDGDWDGVESVRVRVNNFERDMKYKVEASEDKKTALLTPEVPLENDDYLFWWTSTTETKTVMAWAPYERNLDEEFDLPTEWKKEDFARYDIIGVAMPIRFEDRNEPLKFRHLMAKIVINLRKTDYLEKAQNIKVQIIGTHKARFYTKYDDLYLEMLKSGYITPYRLPEETYEDVDFGDGPERPFASYMALSYSEGLAYETSLFQIEVDGTKYQIGSGDFDFRFNMYVTGITNRFNVTIKENKLDVTIDRSENIGWGTDGVTGSGEVTLP